MESFKRFLEGSFEKSRFIRAQSNFCLMNYIRMQRKEFKLQTKLKYYTQKCGFKKKYNIFYGFQNEKLVEIIDCQFFAFDQKWTFEELEEHDIDNLEVSCSRRGS